MEGEKNPVNCVFILNIIGSDCSRAGIDEETAIVCLQCRRTDGATAVRRLDDECVFCFVFINLVMYMCTSCTVCAHVAKFLFKFFNKFIMYCYPGGQLLSRRFFEKFLVLFTVSLFEKKYLHLVTGLPASKLRGNLRVSLQIASMSGS